MVGAGALRKAPVTIGPSLISRGAVAEGQDVRHWLPKRLEREGARGGGPTVAVHLGDLDPVEAAVVRAAFGAGESPALSRSATLASHLHGPWTPPSDNAPVRCTGSCERAVYRAACAARLLC